MPYDPREIIETIYMTEVEHLDIRTVTMGISLRKAANHVKTVETVSSEFDIPIRQLRVAARDKGTSITSSSAHRQ